MLIWLLFLIAVVFLLLPSRNRYLHAALDVYACMHSYIQVIKTIPEHVLPWGRLQSGSGDRYDGTYVHHQNYIVVARKGGNIVGKFMCSAVTDSAAKTYRTRFGQPHQVRWDEHAILDGPCGELVTQCFCAIPRSQMLTRSAIHYCINQHNIWMKEWMNETQLI